MNQQVKLSAELEKWGWLRPRLEADDFDAVSLMSALESETNIKECLLEIAESAIEDEHSVQAVKARIKELQERASRLAERAEKKRRIVTGTMQNLEINDPIQGPTLTLSLRAGSRGVIVTDLAKIPKEYFDDADPKLNKRRLFAAMDGGAKVDGAELPNMGSKSVAILVK